MIENRKLLFFGELPKISMNGIAINNLKILIYMKSKFQETFYIQDLPHKKISSYLKIVIRLFYSIYLIAKNKNLTIYFTLSHGNLGICKSLILAIFSIIFKKKYILHLHRGDLIENCESQLYKKIICKLILSKSQFILFISNKQLLEVKEFFNLNYKKLYFIPNLPSFNIKRKYLRSINSSGSNSFFKAIFIGPVIKSKGVDILLEELFMEGRDLSNKLNVQLMIIGRNYQMNLLEKYKSFIEKRFIIIKKEQRHHKVISDLINSDVLILPSLSEGMPYVILEALIIRKPVICSKVGYIIEILGEDYPFYINLEKPYLIKEHLQYIRENKDIVKSIIDTKRRRALKYFDLSNLKNFIKII